VREETRPHCGMTSSTVRKEFYTNTDIPGVGNYDMKEHLAIGFQKI